MHGFKQQQAMEYIFYTKPMQQHFDSRKAVGGEHKLKDYNS